MNADIVSYIETDETWTSFRRATALRGDLIGVRDSNAFASTRFARYFNSEIVIGPDRHIIGMCSEDTLCTGEGYRWRPGDPILRFGP